MANHPIVALRKALKRRFGSVPPVEPATRGLEQLAGMAARGSCRDFADRPVDPGLVRLLCAVALSAPSKSDLQQRDIVIVDEPPLRARLDLLAGREAWIRAAPVMVVFCANNRRQRQIQGWRDRPFANDHLDAFFNASIDAGIAMAAFITAAEAAGLGCCPLSVLRNNADAVSDLLHLPDHVFPVAGLVLGWPAGPGEISPRLPLEATVHMNRFDEAGIEQAVAEYDRRRAEIQPYPRQRNEARFGHSGAYGWSEDKARQYAEPQRADFGAFIRRKGFDLG
ncbi:MAG TPA: nitroreductase family protein [Azospirillaceae bacterium]|nr:nitroreductase family protein [Azospirillaceae bacterium]